MTVVVLDANAMPHGHFNDRTLRQLRNIIGASSSIIVPEVVVWSGRNTRIALKSL